MKRMSLRKTLSAATLAGGASQWKHYGCIHGSEAVLGLVDKPEVQLLAKEVGALLHKVCASLRT